VQQQKAFAETSSHLLEHLSGAQSVLGDLQQANRRFWPTFSPMLERGSEAGDAVSQATDDTLHPGSHRSRSFTIDGEEATLRVLHIHDLKMGYGGGSCDVVSSLEDNSVANLLEDRISHALQHMGKLHARVADKRSKILVTGDLNAGKSTLVNALLRKQLLPVDQQPCTMVFCEVVDAEENESVEEVHGVPDIALYDPEDPSTYESIDDRHLEDVVTDEMQATRPLTQLKIYARDGHVDRDASFLHNGIVDVSLIDSPGLNRDSIKTTEVFARQEEIDVIMFVVNAENHFTLSVWLSLHCFTHVLRWLCPCRPKSFCKTPATKRHTCSLL